MVDLGALSHAGSPEEFSKVVGRVVKEAVEAVSGAPIDEVFDYIQSLGYVKSLPLVEKKAARYPLQVSPITHGTFSKGNDCLDYDTNTLVTAIKKLIPKTPQAYEDAKVVLVICRLAGHTGISIASYKRKVDWGE